MVRNMAIAAMITPAMATDPFDVEQPLHGDLRLGPGAAKRMAGARRFDDNTMRAGAKADGSPGWLEEAIMSEPARRRRTGRQRPSSACDPMRTSRSVCASGFS